MSGAAVDVQLVEGPPPASAVARMGAIEGVEMRTTVLTTQRGLAGHLGPEAAGALLVLQATLADPERAEPFWHQAAELMELLSSAPGFIRRYNFADGPHYTLLAFWQTQADADAFYGRPEHQRAIKALFENRWQYSHFAGLWVTATPRSRLIFCRHCDGVTPVDECRCRGCGVTLYDPFDPCGAGHVG